MKKYFLHVPVLRFPKRRTGFPESSRPGKAVLPLRNGRTAQASLVLRLHTSPVRLHTSPVLRLHTSPVLRFPKRRTGCPLPFVCIALFLMCLCRTFAQDTSSTKRINFDMLTAAADADKPLFLRYGLWGSAQWNSHFAGFTNARGFETTAPVVFGQQNPLQILISPSAAFGAMVEFPLAGRFGVGLRAAYSLLWGSFSQQETFLYFLSRNELATGTLEHRFTSRLGNILLEPVVTYRILDALTLHAGLQVGYAPAPTFSSQTIALGNTPSFSDGSRVSDVFTDKALPRRAALTENLSLALVGGISYEIPLNATGTVLFAPELWYAHPLRAVPADVVKLGGSDGEWRISSLRLAASVRWSPFRTIRPELTPELQEKIQELKRYDSVVSVQRVRNEERLRQVDSTNRVITARMEEMKKLGVVARITRIVGISANGVETELPTLRVEEFRATMQHQILPLIQFDENSAKLPLRYRSINAAERGNFTLKQLAEKPALEAYRHILNIIGKRMTDAASAVLYLAPSAAANEQNPTQTAERRALAVSGYLQDVWKIAEKRIVIAKPTTTKQGAEARQVALSGNTPELLDALSYDAVRRSVEPERIRIETDVSVGSGLKQWRVEARQFTENEDVLLKEFQGSATAPGRIEWSLADDRTSVPASLQDVAVQLSVTDSKNINTESPLTTLPVKQRSLVQKDAEEGDAERRIRICTVSGFVNSQPDEATLRLIELLKTALKSASTLILRYSTESGKANAQAVMRLFGVRAGGNVQLRQVEFTPGLPETADVRLYGDAVEVEVR